jgi:hypothetical protein
MKKNIESFTAQTILEKKQEIIIGDKTYLVAPPTTATIIEVSALISQLPSANIKPDSILIESLVIAKDCEIIGKVVAMLILGAGNTTKTETVVKNRFFGLFNSTEEVTTDLLTPLAKELLYKIPPSELQNKTIQLLMGMEFDHFFGFTTSLIEINLIRATREVVKTTASGQ